MPQTKQDRHYWAERRKREGRNVKGGMQPAHRRQVVLLATSIQEYGEIKRMHPGVKVRLDTSNLQQTQLLDTKEFLDV